MVYDVSQLPEYLARYIEIDDDGCWIWMRGGTTAGYGTIYTSEKLHRPQYVHRMVYSLLVGELIVGMDIDHLCKKRRCCRPGCLEQITHRENILRGDSIPADNARKNQCKRGHPFTDENTKGGNGHRTCRTCINERARTKYQPHKRRKTHCKHGHEFTPGNTAIYRGWQRCRECAGIRYREQALASRRNLVEAVLAKLRDSP